MAVQEYHMRQELIACLTIFAILMPADLCDSQPSKSGTAVLAAHQSKVWIHQYFSVAGLQGHCPLHEQLSTCS